MADFQTVCREEELPAGTAKAVQVQGKIIAVFCERPGEYHAIDDACPHMGASLCDGHVEDGIVTCSWHAWRFSIRDGTWADNPRIKIGSYPTRVVDGEVQVQVESPSPEQSSSTES